MSSSHHAPRAKKKNGSDDARRKRCVQRKSSKRQRHTSQVMTQHVYPKDFLWRQKEAESNGGGVIFISVLYISERWQRKHLGGGGRIKRNIGKIHDCRKKI